MLLVTLVTFGPLGVVFAPTTVADQHSTITVAPEMTTTNGSVGGCSLVVEISDTPVTPTDGILAYGCPGIGNFAVSQSGNYTPTFTFPQYYTGLAVTPATTCINYAATGQVAPTPISSGQQVQLYTTNPYLLCAHYANVPSSGGTLPSFTITWSDGSSATSQTFPSVSIPARTGTFQGCSSTVFDYNYSGQPTAVGGTLLFSCSVGTGFGCSQGGCAIGTPAFNVSQTAYYTPNFNLPQYYTGLSLAGVNGCHPPMAYGGPPVQIASGTETLLRTGGVYVYCADYTNFPAAGGTLSGFTISWGPGPTIFSQKITSVTVPPKPPPPPAIVGCSTTLLDPVTAATSVNGTLEFECMGGGPYTAFAVSTAGYYTPTFTLPQPYAGLSITSIADSVSNCAKPTPGYSLPTPIASGASVYLTPNADSGG